MEERSQHYGLSLRIGDGLLGNRRTLSRSPSFPKWGKIIAHAALLSESTNGGKIEALRIESQHRVWTASGTERQVIDAHCFQLHIGMGWFELECRLVKLVAIREGECCLEAVTQAVLDGKSVEGRVSVVTYLPCIATLCMWTVLKMTTSFVRL